MLTADLADALVFANDAPLPSPVEGRTDVRRAFESRGRRDHTGRSLRDLDLATRVFRYPLSYLIDSDLFAVLPEATRTAVLAEVRARLTRPEGSPRAPNQVLDRRQAALEILREIRPDFGPQ